MLRRRIGKLISHSNSEIQKEGCVNGKVHNEAFI